jgi:hypothetical protein
MALSFPNPSRIFDAAKNRIEFWGYDNVFEISFFVEADALRKLCPEMAEAEAGLLTAFDAAQKRIYAAAEKIYKRGSKRLRSYTLVGENF